MGKEYDGDYIEFEGEYLNGERWNGTMEEIGSYYTDKFILIKGKKIKINP